MTAKRLEPIAGQLKDKYLSAYRVPRGAVVTTGPTSTATTRLRRLLAASDRAEANNHNATGIMLLPMPVLLTSPGLSYDYDSTIHGTEDSHDLELTLDSLDATLGRERRTTSEQPHQAHAPYAMCTTSTAAHVATPRIRFESPSQAGTAHMCHNQGDYDALATAPRSRHRQRALPTARQPALSARAATCCQASRIRTLSPRALMIKSKAKIG